MAKFETPELKEYLEVPAIKNGSMAHSGPFVAAPSHQEPLGFPGELVDNWENVAIEKMGELLVSIAHFGFSWILASSVVPVLTSAITF
jgi:hypothetical protein